MNSSRRRLVLFIPLAVLTAIVWLFAQQLAAPKVQGYIESPLIGKPLPYLGIDLPPPPFIINVFASWCAPCAIEHAPLMDMQKQGVKIVGIAFKDSRKNIDEWLKKRGNPYVSVQHDKGQALTLGITGVPESFAVDKDGIVRMRFQGPLEEPQTIKDFLQVMQ